MKSQLRSQLRLSLKALSPAARRRRSKRIIRKLLGSREFKTSKRIVSYVSRSGEVETRDFLRRALKLKKKVFVPRIHKKTRRIQIFEIKNVTQDLKRGSYGILEPKRGRSRAGRPSEIDLVVVPGLGFDRRGRRLGRGGGYFDRFLKQAKRAEKIGLAFKEQVVKSIPVNRRDVAVDRVLTG